MSPHETSTTARALEPGHSPDSPLPIGRFLTLYMVVTLLLATAVVVVAPLFQ
ncbi:hypothetical protein ACFS5L_41515 [Streptomyces phyllanthi]|uniref:hypothetical protein n=1 Tax=Streptomyces phyllanthi TaxID=1803180 RepID=UPI0018832F6A|nr:hypothetical protein [Streptomyces phyllanthi]